MLVRKPGIRDIVNILIAHHLAGRRVSMLEAGGGSRTPIDTRSLDLTGITTVDISAEQLARNNYADEKILGDLQDFVPGRRWDLVVINNVLEHVPRADLAVANLVEACAEGGLIMVGGPCANAFSGFVTRVTPHWFHILVYRLALGERDAGKPGHAPFRTYFHPMSQPARLTAYLESRGFECLFLGCYEGRIYDRMRRHRPLIGWPLMAVTAMINVFTPKRYNARYGEFCALYRRKTI